MTDKEKTIKELKEALDSLDVTNEYRLNLIRAIEYLQEEPVSEDILDVSRIDYRLQHKSIEDGIKYHAEEYSFNIESVLYNQLTGEQQKLWRKELERAVISGCYYGLELSRDKRYKENQEPVSDDLEEAAKRYALNNTPWDDCADEMQDAFKAGAQWQKTKDESATKDLGEYINELSKQFPEVSFAKLSRIAVRVAKWQKEHFEKERLKHCDALTAEQAQIESDFVVNHLKKNNRTPTFLDAIEYGMKKMKEQMMAKAVDGRVLVNGMGNPILHLWDKGRHLVDKKVKVIIIEEG